MKRAGERNRSRRSIAEKMKMNKKVNKGEALRRKKRHDVKHEEDVDFSKSPGSEYFL